MPTSAEYIRRKKYYQEYRKRPDVVAYRRAYDKGRKLSKKEDIDLGSDVSPVGVPYDRELVVPDAFLHAWTARYDTETIVKK